MLFSFLSLVSAWGGFFALIPFGLKAESFGLGFSNHRHYVEFFVAVQLFMQAFFLEDKSRAVRFFIVPLSVSIVFLSIFFTGARASFLAYMLGVGFLVFCCRDVFWIYVLSFLFSLFFYCIYLYVFFVDASVLGGGSVFREGSSGRLELWGLAFQAWLGSPVFGLGGLGFSTLGNSIAAHPHNLFLQLLSEYGFFGVLFFLIISFFVFWGVLNRKKISLFVSVPLFSLYISSFFGGVLVVPVTQLLFFYLLVSVIFESGARVVRLPGWLGVLVSCCVLGMAFYSYDAPGKRAVPDDAPRFWQKGGLPI